jgi:hypothetical protein
VVTVEVDVEAIGRELAATEDELALSGKDGNDAQKYQLLDVRNILKKLREVQEK